MIGVLNIETSASMPYGNIRRIGTNPNGRALYQVIDSKGNETNKLSVPTDEADKFESAYLDIIDSAPKIQEYVSEHSTAEDKKKRKILSQTIIGTGGILGAALPLMFVKTQSVTKKILSTVTGIIAGLSAGYITSLVSTTPPGSFKFAKAMSTFSRLDIKNEE